MLPYIHVGPLTLGTYGIFLAIGVLIAAVALSKDLRRRAIDADPNVIAIYTAIAGVIGSRLYSLMETPSEFFANPWPMLFSRSGFTWSGGVLGGFITLAFLARHYRMPLLRMLDIASPAGAIGYGIGRIGCLVSGDGDYGTPTSLPWGMSFPNGLVPTTERVHPTPIYEFLGAVVIFWIIWRLGARTMGDTNAIGKVFAYYLILTGIARFFVEFIRLNPRILFGLTNAQIISILCVLIGGVILFRLRRRAA
ncbi:MAG TPA: prolipoprotein diacylglyceryl transferase [Candidatus Acidoferrales bacterium]|jgi:phosphatidylglycerol:prolipoprotein diacylglycerol transferase|nr:prolipoprotein diacylglyceryl transferase [Candidatus Acidoferrales bacterium]